MITTLTIDLWGDDVKHDGKIYYVVPLQKKSYVFDNVDLIKGAIVDKTFDFSMDSKISIVRVYSTYASKKRKPFGTFTHNFDKKINPKTPYKKEYLASRLKYTPKDACESGWHDIAKDVYLGKLRDLDAIFDAKSGLCSVYDNYGYLKATLLIKNKHIRAPIRNTLKLLQNPDGTEVLFTKDKNGTWSNTQGAPMNFLNTSSGYEITLDNGDKEIYDLSGKLIEIDKGELTVSLKYHGHKLVKVLDNHGHALRFQYKKSLLRKVTNYDGSMVKYKYNKKRQLDCVVYGDEQKMLYSYDKKGRLLKIYKNQILIKRYKYDTKGRVRKSIGIKGRNIKHFSYKNSSVKVKENGEIIEYSFVVNHSQSRIETIQSPNGLAVYAYDNYGHQISFTDKLGITRVTLYDKNGLLKKDIDKAGTPQENVVNIEYDTTLRKPTVIKMYKKIIYNIYNKKVRRIIRWIH